MMKRLLILLLCAAFSVSSVASNLPDLGDVASADLSPLAERKLGESIMRDLRWRDPAYLDDPEIEGYVNRLGRRLVEASGEGDRPFHFFVIRDPSINAFALPGGFIGLHSGLITTAETESELASVVGHEIAHVTQRHIAQLFGRQSQAGMIMMASVLVAILAARSNSDVSEAALAAGQAGAIQQQLGYTRAFEREADRIGLQILDRGGFDPQAMPRFFERLQRSSRLYENNAPGYLRTHPLTEERISDMGNRVAQMRYRQVLDSPDFGFVRTKLLATEGAAVDVLRAYEGRIASGEDGVLTRYGQAIALLRLGRADAALEVLLALRGQAEDSPFIESALAEAHLAARDSLAAIDVLESAVARFPEHRSLDYLLIESLLRADRAADAAVRARGGAIRAAGDERYWALASRSEAALGRMSAYHRAQAEVYVLRGSLPAAVEQLELARRAGDGDFHEMSAIDARLRMLKQEEEAERRSRR